MGLSSFKRWRSRDFLYSIYKFYFSKLFSINSDFIDYICYMDDFTKDFIKSYIKGKLEPSDEPGYFDLEGDLDISNSSVSAIPIKFKRISGNFIAKGSALVTFTPPKYIGGTMDLTYCYNLLPIFLCDCLIKGDFKTSIHTDLKLIPRFVEGQTFLLGCPLVSLEGIDKIDRPNQIKYISTNREGISKSTFRSLFSNCYNFKDFDYIVSLLVTMSNIDDREELAKLNKGFRPINNFELDRNSDMIIELLKSGILKPLEISSILKSGDNNLFESIDKKTGGKLDLSNNLWDLGF